MGVHDARVAARRPSPADRPRVCVLTPAGRGAIAVVAIEGPGAVEAVDRLFQPASGKPLAEVAVGQISFGRWRDADGEEVIVTRDANSVEVHCHGGFAASRAIVESLAAVGCVAVDQAVWLRETTVDPIAAAAQAALGTAITRQAALVLLDQYHGALRSALEQVIDLIDADRAEQALARLTALYDRRAIGERLTTPARVVLTGPPNVGKSSLINALVGYERAIVFDTPGTTRDVVTATTAVGGWAVELIDTAGLRLAASGVEQAGIELARSVIADADLVLRVAEAKTMLADQAPATVFDEWTAGKQVIEIANKIDQLSGEQLANLRGRASDALMLTSATERIGIAELLAAIDATLSPEPLEAGTAVPFNLAQIDRVREARKHLEMGDRVAAKQSVLALLET